MIVRRRTISARARTAARARFPHPAYDSAVAPPHLNRGPCVIDLCPAPANWRLPNGRCFREVANRTLPLGHRTNQEVLGLTGVRLGVVVLKAFLAFLLLASVVMVFGNVVLRYVFNTGIDVSEELSRWSLVWITFIGAALALKEGKHLGVDAFVVTLSRPGRSVCFLITRSLMLTVSVLFSWGSLRQTLVDWDVAAPVTGLSQGYFYGVSVFFGVVASLIIAWDLWRLFTGQLTDGELVGHVDDGELT